MKTLIKKTGFFMLIAALAGCTKDVTIDLPQLPQQLVVEGHIEPNQQAYLYLSHNFSFFGSTSITSILAQDVVHGAKIAITDGHTTDSMKEIIPMLGYYQSITMTGVVGRTYSITINALGQTLTSSTTILQPIKLDTAWFQVQPGMDTLGYMWAVLTDPPPAGHCYRWLAMRIGKDTTFIPPDYSVFNDQFITGQKFEFYYDRGVFPGSKAEDDMNIERHYFKTGETVVIKFCTIDNTAYQFYNMYYFQQGNIGNPFGSPAPLPTNINGGIGIWCAYGSYLDTVLCK